MHLVYFLSHLVIDAPDGKASKWLPAGCVPHEAVTPVIRNKLHEMSLMIVSAFRSVCAKQSRMTDFL